MEGIPNNQQEILTSEDRGVFSKFGLNENHRAVNENKKPLNLDGDIFLRSEYVDGEDVLVWGVKAGSHFSPAIHRHGHTLSIASGQGLITVGGREIEYKEGDVFNIAGSVPHGLVKVNKTTVVFEKLLTD